MITVETISDEIFKVINKFGYNSYREYQIIEIEIDDIEVYLELKISITELGSGRRNEDDGSFDTQVIFDSICIRNFCANKKTGEIFEPDFSCEQIEQLLINYLS